MTAAEDPMVREQHVAVAIASAVDAEAEHHEKTEQLVAASDELDKRLARNADLQDALVVIRKMRRLMNMMWFAGGLVFVMVLVLAVTIVKVEANSNQIVRDREARLIFCSQTNANNDEARTKFIALFVDSPRQAQITAIADVAWPHRNCQQLAP